MIFLDHIPDDIVAWLTPAPITASAMPPSLFVFISGYLAATSMVRSYAPGFPRRLQAAVDTRLADATFAHIMLFLLFTAQIARTVRNSKPDV